MSEATAPMKVIDAIYQRRSVRSYSAQKLEPATIRALLKAAVWAPTAIHEEPWAFAIVQDSAYLKRLSDRANRFHRRGASRAFGSRCATRWKFSPSRL
jgi:nitroreductase